MKKNVSRLNLRFEDAKLRRQIEVAAKNARRSRNSEIILRLQQTFDAEERERTTVSMPA